MSRRSDRWLIGVMAALVAAAGSRVGLAAAAGALAAPPVTSAPGPADTGPT